jgi:YhcH/YjgK/YiaL family protein
MRYAPMQSMTLEKPYDPQRDIIVWNGDGQRHLLSAGNFVIFFPHDAHMGGLVVDEPRTVKKIVFKLGVE